MRLSRLLVVSVCVVVVMSGLSGCGRKTEAPPAKKTIKLRLSGSGTAYPLVKILADAYHRENTEVEFVFLPNVHSKGGIVGAADGSLEIGMVSREMTPDEMAMGLDYRLLSNDGLVVASHADTKIGNLSKEAVRRIYSGEIRNWQEIGGGDHAIIVLDRNEDESAKIILRKYVLGEVSTLKTTDRAIILYYEKDMINSLKETPSSIGYLSLGSMVSQKLGLNLISVDGVTPSIQNIMDGKYSMVRPLGIVTKQNASPAVKSFVGFCTSNAGRDLMLRNGFVPAE